MNRPFYAFGALLIALALAMLAVSSTSRSTSVSRESVATPQNTVPAAASSAQPARAARFCGILVVLPAEEALSTAVAEVRCPGVDETPTYCTGSGPDWFPDVVVHGSAACPLLGGRSVVLAVEPVQSAPYDPALLRDESSRDCRSHHDPAYDDLVYGEEDGTISSRPSSTSGDDQAAAADRVSRGPVGWNEYAELMDHALRPEATDSPTAESTIPVRSSRLLLDFAASTLRHAGQLLQSAADEMQHSANSASRDRLAEEPSAEQR